MKMFVPSNRFMLVVMKCQLFFCTANILRATGTIDNETINETYVRNMSIEKTSSLEMQSSRNQDNGKVEVTPDEEATKNIGRFGSNDDV